MSRPITSLDEQRVTFIESLHSSLKKQASKALAEHKRFVTIAKAYLNDGLEESECTELLMIDGISREAAESYTAMASSKDSSEDNSDLSEYSFRYEDESGKIVSSYDIGRTVKASSDDDAWTKAEECMDSVDFSKILSVSRV